MRVVQAKELYTPSDPDGDFLGSGFPVTSDFSLSLTCSVSKGGERQSRKV